MRYVVEREDDERGTYWTVADTEVLQNFNRGCWSRPICRTVSVADANMICAALNAGPDEIIQALEEAREDVATLRDRLNEILGTAP